MIGARPGFFEDWGRFSLGIALKKRFGRFMLSGVEYRYAQILAMSAEERTGLLREAARANAEHVLCWTFESLAIAHDGDHRLVWRTLLELDSKTIAGALPPILSHYLDDASELSDIEIPASMAKPLAVIACRLSGTVRNALRRRECETLATHCLGLLDDDALLAAISKAARQGESELMSLAYATLLERKGGQLAKLLPLLIERNDDEVAGKVLAMVVTREDDGELEGLPLSARGSYLVGKAYSDLAFAAKGSDKGRLQANKKRALHHLGEAREKCNAHPHEGDVDPYRAAAIAAALTASVAAAYEAAAYLQWKGTRTTALAE